MNSTFQPVHRQAKIEFSHSETLYGIKFGKYVQKYHLKPIIVQLPHIQTVKTIILKHGGIGMHRHTMPFFLGLIPGDYLVGGGWAVWLLFGIDTYILSIIFAS